MSLTPDCGKVIILPRVDSTNNYAKEHFSVLEDGTVVIAEEQFAGRGRLGRKWIAAPGTSLTASVVLKNISQPFHAGAILGLAGLELVRDYLPGVAVFFKWPNDIYIRECKLAGILSEGIIAHGKLAGVVSGIGINVNQSKEDLQGMDNFAVSLCSVAEKRFFLEKMRFELAEKIKKYYIMYQSNSANLLKLWRDENRLIGETLVLTTADGREKQGCFTGIGDRGEMLLRSPDGVDFCFDCGDVKINTALINFNNLENKINQK
ncbi:MAG: biotin--[acetyl-CoA-carboxylase] ligase [Lentisphaerae bacterium]|nr:biotin--[acetyl-CoA-carboxylase] ligase [Lentisphaerota bacterium]